MSKLCNNGLTLLIPIRNSTKLANDDPLPTPHTMLFALMVSTTYLMYFIYLMPYKRILLEYKRPCMFSSFHPIFYFMEAKIQLLKVIVQFIKYYTDALVIEPKQKLQKAMRERRVAG